MSIAKNMIAALAALLDDDADRHAEALRAVHREVPQRATEIERAAEADRVAQRRRRALELKDPNGGKFPGRAVDVAIVATDDSTSAMRQGMLSLASRKLVLVLGGSVGVGKTVAATRIALDAGGSTPKFIRAATLERRGRYSKSLDRDLDTASMLVIDDLGSEVLDGAGNFRSLLDEVIDSFYASGRRLVITTNLHLKREHGDEAGQFVERYGQRIASRLAECGQWSNCGNRDLRRDQLKLGGA